VILRVSAKFFSGGRGQWKHRDREMAPISLPPFYQWRVRGRTGHAPRAHLKATVHQEPHVKSEDFFTKNNHFQKNAYLLRKIQPDFVRKALHPGLHLALITPVPERRSAQQRTTMIGEISWIVLTIRVLVEKHISGHRPPLPPSVDAYALFCRRRRS